MYVCMWNRGIGILLRKSKIHNKSKVRLIDSESVLMHIHWAEPAATSTAASWRETFSKISTVPWNLFNLSLFTFTDTGQANTAATMPASWRETILYSTVLMISI